MGRVCLRTFQYLEFFELMHPFDRRIMIDPGNLVPKAWKLVVRQKEPRLPSFLRRRKSIDFAESASYAAATVRFHIIYKSEFNISNSPGSHHQGGGKYSKCEVRLEFVQ